MSPDYLLTIAIVVFTLMFVGLVLTYREFHQGAAKRQQEGQEDLRESPHGKA
ncbi:MAG: hypothetical protein ACI9FR_001293 [Cryomorphaceae bacterium]|jgi:hypothetical protein